MCVPGRRLEWHLQVLVREAAVEIINKFWGDGLSWMVEGFLLGRARETLSRMDDCVIF